MNSMWGVAQFPKMLGASIRLNSLEMEIEFIASPDPQYVATLGLGSSLLFNDLDVIVPAGE